MLSLGSIGIIVFAIYMTMLMAIGVVAALMPMLPRSTRIEMSPTALKTFFPERAAGIPAMRA